MYRLYRSPRDSGRGFNGFLFKGSFARSGPPWPVFAFVSCAFSRAYSKEVSLMNLTKLSKLGILLSLPITTLFIASEAPAQSCQCYDSVSTVRVRRAPVRHYARRARVRRTYTTARPTYQATTYVPVVREVTYAPRYVAYADNSDCGEAYVPSARVVVTEPVYTTARARNVYYSPVPEVAYTTGANVVVTDYATSAYDTRRIASGWGHRDGFKDGYKAALKYRAYNPQNNGDYWDANNGYKRRFGDKYLYKSAYRDSYVSGYDAGWRSINQSRVINY